MKIKLKTISQPQCKLCSIKGEVLYTGLTDIIGTTEGEWLLRKCPTCGLLWYDPMPSREDIALAYTEYPTHEVETTRLLSLKERVKLGYLAGRYGFTPVKLSPLYNYLGYLLWLLPFKRVSADFWFKALGDMAQKGRLLDIGSGRGDLIQMMNDWGWQAEGIEPDYQAFRNACLKGLKVTNGDFLSHEFADETFDAVISSHVFEHVHDPVGFLKKCYKILRPNGIICIATPNSSSWQHSLFKNNWMAIDAPRHLFIFNPTSMRICAEQSGIKNYTITSTSRGSRFIASASLMIKKKGAYHWHDEADIKTDVMSNLLEIIEYILVSFRKDKGVELFFTAYKR